MTTLPNRPRTALIVIDVQNGVVDGAPKRDDVVANINDLVGQARAQDVPVIWVQHNDDGLPRGSKDWEMVPELARGDSEPLVHKSYGDSFEATELESLLAEREVGRLIVTGAETDACIPRPCTARSPGATTSRWSATPTRPGTRPSGERRPRRR